MVNIKKAVKLLCKIVTLFFIVSKNKSNDIPQECGLLVVKITSENSCKKVINIKTKKIYKS